MRDGVAYRYMAHKNEEQEVALLGRNQRNHGADAESEIIFISDDEVTTREQPTRQEHLPSSERSPQPPAQIGGQEQAHPLVPAPPSAHHQHITSGSNPTAVAGQQAMQIDGGGGGHHGATADVTMGEAAIMGLLELLVPVVICKSSSCLGTPDACVQADMGLAAVDGRLTHLVGPLGENSSEGEGSRSGTGGSEMNPHFMLQFIVARKDVINVMLVMHTMVWSDMFTQTCDSGIHTA